jgi:predicted nucleic acid-binding protein
MITNLTDSDWLVDYLSGKAASLDVLQPLIRSGTLAMSIVTYGEVYEGVLNRIDTSELIRALVDLVSGVPIIGLDTQTAQTFASLRADLRSSGQLIPDHDIWIAATALQYDLTLVTRDRHFERIAVKRH